MASDVSSALLMEKKLSWDDIPSLDGLEVDREYKSETALDKRSFVRITKDLKFLP